MLCDEESHVDLKFRGTIHHKDFSDQEVVTIAQRFHHRAANANEVQMSFFTSSACGGSLVGGLGAYSVIFTEMKPQTGDHGKTAAMAWSSKAMEEHFVAEATAVIQALYIAHDRFNTFQPPSHGPTPVLIQVFTPCPDVIQLVNKTTKWRGRTYLRNIQAMMFEASASLGNLPNVEVDLHLYYLDPRHGAAFQPQAKTFASACQERAIEGGFMFTLDGEAVPLGYMTLPSPAHKKLSDLNEADTTRRALNSDRVDHTHHVNKKQRTKGPEAATSLVWNYHDTYFGQRYDPVPEPFTSCFSDPEQFYDSDIEIEACNPRPASSKPTSPKRPDPEWFLTKVPSPPPNRDSASFFQLPLPGINKPLWWHDLKPDPAKKPAKKGPELSLEEKKQKWEEEEVVFNKLAKLQDSICVLHDIRTQGGHALTPMDEQLIGELDRAYIGDMRQLEPEHPMVRDRDAEEARQIELLATVKEQMLASGIATIQELRGQGLVGADDQLLQSLEEKYVDKLRQLKLDREVLRAYEEEQAGKQSSAW